MTRRSERGFTLIELLVSIVIIGAISGAMTQAVIVGLRTTNATDQKLAESTDAQLISTWFTTDVQSAQTIEKTGISCVDTAAGQHLVVRLSWNDTGIAEVMSYVYQDVSGARQLIRRHCTDDGFGHVDLVSAQTMARALTTSTVATDIPTAACAPVACTPFPTLVTLTLTDQSKSVYQVTSSTRTTS